jgi:hypothetical protein
MSLFMETVNESYGWARKLTYLIPFIGPFIHDEITAQSCLKLLRNSKLRNYLSKKATQILNTEKRNNPSLAKYNENYKDKNEDTWTKYDNKVVRTKYGDTIVHVIDTINGFVFEVYGNTKHIQGIRFFAFDTKAKKVVAFEVPPPDDKEMGYFKE